MKQSALAKSIEECEKQVSSIIKSEFDVSDFEPKVEISKEFGDLSFACFPLAAKTKKNPAEIAKIIASEFKSPGFSKAEALNGFANFFLNNSFYSKVLEESVGKNYGESKDGEGKTFVVEFSQPNVGKPFHVGHIRSTILGDVISNLLESQGWKTVRMNYIGDSGTQVAKLILATEIYHDLPKIENEKHMLEYYVRVNKEIEENPELADKARKILEKIEEGDESIAEKISFVREKSYEAFQRNYDMLEVKFDIVVGESKFVKPSKKIVQEAVSKGIAFVDKGGETVVKLEPQLPNFIVLRSNGTTLYSTRDLALSEFKKSQYNFDQSVILTSSDQNMHFRQVIKTLELLGREYYKNYKHLGFGLISLQEGKLSSREGRVVFLEDVLNQAISYSRQEIESINDKHNIAEKKKNMGEDEVSQASKIIGVGSAKFAVLRITPEKNIMFDLKKIVSFEGDTGAYVQYTCVRAKSVLEKVGSQSKAKEIAFNAEEAKVAKLLAQFPSALKHAAGGMQPHQLCDYLLKLSAEFNAFYHAHSVLKAENEEEKAKRILLVEATANVLEKGLEMLGIHVPDKM